MDMNRRFYNLQVDLLARSAVSLRSAIPTRVIVGPIVTGPMERRRKPISPVKPITIWNKDDNIKAP